MKQRRRALEFACAVFALIAAAIIMPKGHSGATTSSDAFPPELTHFVPYENNPVFTAEGEGHWDVKIRERGWILREGDQWKMWYTGYDDTRPGKKMLGYATSTDGFKWERFPRNPIVADVWVEDVCIVPVNGIYYMFAEGEGDIMQLHTSRDGLDWKHEGRVDIRKVDGTPIPEGPYGTPTAWYEDGTWNLFYERGDHGIWLARSTDTKVFTNVQDEPVMVPGPENYDRDQVAMNQIIRYKDRYYAICHGAKDSTTPKTPRVWSTWIASSPDLIHWTKYSRNPLQPIAENKSSGLLIHDGHAYRLYTMHNQVIVHHSVVE